MVNKRDTLKAQLKPIIREVVSEVLGEMLLESKIADIVAKSVTQVLSEHASTPRQLVVPTAKKKMSVKELFAHNVSAGGTASASHLDERAPVRPAPSAAKLDVGGIDVFAGLQPIGRGDSPQALMAEQVGGTEISDDTLASLGVDFDVMTRVAGIEPAAEQPVRTNYLEEQRLAQMRSSLDVPANSPEGRVAMQNARPR